MDLADPQLDKCDFGVGIKLCQTCQARLLPAIQGLWDDLSRDGEGGKEDECGDGRFLAKFTVPRSHLTAVNLGCWFCFFIWNDIADIPLQWSFAEMDLRVSGNSTYYGTVVKNGVMTRNSARILQRILPTNARYPRIHDTAAIVYRYLHPPAGGQGQLEPMPERGRRERRVLADIWAAEVLKEPDFPSTVRLETIKAWIRSCDTTHDCNRGCVRDESGIAALAFVPTRLLEIDTYLGSPSIRMIETGDGKGHKVPRYATLSHSWGKEPFLTLREENYQTFLERIPLRQLGKTFREAVYLCWNLGIRYLWIDSLCIIQDTPGDSDWEREAPTMHHVYGASYLTIAATASHACGDGLWRTPKAAPFVDVAIVLPDDSLLYHDKYTPQSSSAVDPAVFVRSNLFGRGWCFQELSLSPRIVHMTDSQMRWICPEESLTEIMEERAGPTFLKPIQHLTVRLDDLWQTVQKKYAVTQVTVAKDRYMALASLAAWFGQRHASEGRETTYIAGCWQHNLINELAWVRVIRTGGSLPRFKVPPPLILPTWSWLTWENVDFWYTSRRKEGDGHETLMKLTDCDVAPLRPDNPYAGPVSATLYLTAPVCEMSRRPRADDGEVRRSVGSLQDFTANWAVTLLQGRRAFQDSSNAADKTPSNGWMTVVFDDLSTELTLGTDFSVIFAPISCHTKPASLNWIEGLVLRRCMPEDGEPEPDDHEPPLYERIGWTGITLTPISYGIDGKNGGKEQVIDFLRSACADELYAFRLA